MKSGYARHYDSRKDDKCITCKSKFHSIVSFTITTKRLTLTKQCLECGHQEIIQREYKERSHNGPRDTA